MFLILMQVETDQHLTDIRGKQRDESITETSRLSTAESWISPTSGLSGLVAMDIERKRDCRPLEQGQTHDFYSCFSFNSLINSILCTVAIGSAWAIEVFTVEQKAPLDALNNYTAYAILMSYLLCVLLTLVLDKFEPRTARRRRLGEFLCTIVFGTTFLLSIFSGYMGLFRSVEYWLRISLVGVYLLLSVLQTRRPSWRDV